MNPKVQFVLGTPPLNRRPPDSPTEPSSNKNWALTPTGSPLRRSGKSIRAVVFDVRVRICYKVWFLVSVVSSPLLTSPFTALNSNSFVPKSGFNARAITLPGENAANHLFFGNGASRWVKIDFSELQKLKMWKMRWDWCIRSCTKVVYSRYERDCVWNIEWETRSFVCTSIS